MSNALIVKGDNLPKHASAAGRGNEGVSASHMTIPRLKQLQKMSDEVDKHHENFIDGAEPGTFMNDLTGELLGEELLIVNINFKDDWVIWRKREKGGGWVATYKSRSEAEKHVADEDNPSDFQIDNTHSHLLLILDEKTGEVSKPIMFDCKSSKLRVSRNWNTQINMKGGDRFAGAWKLKSKPTKNRAGQPFHIIDVEWAGWLNEDTYKQAEAYFEQFN